MKNIKPTGELVLQTLAMPADTNANGDIFGGWLVSQMDLGAGILAKHVSKSRTVTVAINSLTFRLPVQIGDIVSCYADLVKIGTTSITIKMEVWRISHDTEDQALVSDGIFTFVAVDENGKPQTVKRKN